MAISIYPDIAGSAQAGTDDGSGLNQTEVDARIRALVSTHAFKNAMVWPANTIDAAIARDTEVTTAVAAAKSTVESTFAPAFIAAAQANNKITLTRQSGSDPFVITLPADPSSQTPPGYHYHQTIAFTAPNISVSTSIPGGRTDGYVHTLKDWTEYPGGIASMVDFIADFEGFLLLAVDKNSVVDVQLCTSHRWTPDSGPQVEFTSERVYNLRLISGISTAIPLNVFDSRTQVPTGTFNTRDGSEITVDQALLNSPIEIRFQVKIKAYQNNGSRRSDLSITSFSGDRDRVTLFQIGGVGSSGLNRDAVDARVLALVNAIALTSNTSVWPDDKIPAAIARDAELTAALADYVTSTSLTSTLGSYATDDEVTAAIADFISSTAIDTKISTAVSGLLNRNQVSGVVRDYPVLRDRGAWAEANAYAARDITLHNNVWYKAKAVVAASTKASTEPGVGTAWDTSWEVFALTQQAASTGGGFTLTEIGATSSAITPNVRNRWMDTGIDLPETVGTNEVWALEITSGGTVVDGKFHFFPASMITGRADVVDQQGIIAVPNPSISLRIASVWRDIFFGQTAGRDLLFLVISPFSTGWQFKLYKVG